MKQGDGLKMKRNIIIVVLIAFVLGSFSFAYGTGFNMIEERTYASR